MQQSLRMNMCEILSRVQILYQNKQITFAQKDEITTLLKKGLSSSNNVTEASSYLRRIKREVDASFTDIVYECIEMLN